MPVFPPESPPQGPHSPPTPAPLSIFIISKSSWDLQLWDPHSLLHISASSPFPSPFHPRPLTQTQAQATSLLKTLQRRAQMFWRRCSRYIKGSYPSKSSLLVTQVASYLSFPRDFKLCHVDLIVRTANEQCLINSYSKRTWMASLQEVST